MLTCNCTHGLTASVVVCKSLHKVKLDGIEDLQALYPILKNCCPCVVAGKGEDSFSIEEVDTSNLSHVSVGDPMLMHVGKH